MPKSYLQLKITPPRRGLYVHIRTSATVIPWHYYSAPFTPGTDWTDLTIPWNEFEKASWVLPSQLDPTDIKSLGLVAYGKDHQAQLWVSHLGTYE